MRILSALLMLVSLNAMPATYFVRTDGSDSNTGTSNTSGGAWRTIQKAANTIVGGDTAYINEGAYAEAVTINIGDGSAGNYKKFVGVSSPSTTKFTVQDAYCWIEGLTVTNSTVNEIGVRLRASSGNTVITNCTITIAGVGIEVDQTAGIDGLLIERNTITNCNKGIILYGVAGGVGHTVRSNTIVRLNQHGTANDCDYMRIMSGANHRIIGNLSYGSSTNDINTTGSGYPHVDGIQIFAESGNAACTNVLITGNFILDMMAAIQFTDNLGLGHGGWTITNNVFGRGMPIIYTGETNGQAIVNMDDAVNVTTFRHNTSVRMGTAAIFFDCNSVDLGDNVFERCGTSYSFTGTTPGQGTYNQTYPSSSPDAGTGDSTADPVLVDFTNPLGPDGIPWTADDGWRLQASSPAMNTASDRSDRGAYQTSVFRATTARVGTIRSP